MHRFYLGDDIAEMTLEESKKGKADLINYYDRTEASTGLFIGQYAQAL